MIKKKICLVGGFAVGKTSLIQKYVKGIFSENYLTTVGVKIDQRELEIGDEKILLMIWDLAGRDQFAGVKKSYLRGASGVIYVADGTRKETLQDVRDEQAEIATEHPDVPALLLLNKCDLESEWEVHGEELQDFQESGITTLNTSAKTGDNIEEAFRTLTELMLNDPKNS